MSNLFAPAPSKDSARSQPPKDAWTLAPCDVRRAGQPVLNQVTARLPVGSLTALIGPNGAGKSTLLMTLAGLLGNLDKLRAPEGRLIGAMSRAERARLVGWTGADANFAFAFDAESVVLMGRFPWHGGHPGPVDRERTMAALASLDAASLASRAVTSLSSGERQKVGVSRLLAADCALLLFDEPTSNLDLDASMRLMHTLKARAHAGATVVVCMHDLALAHRHADHVLCLAHGKVVASGDTVTSLSPELIGRYFGVHAELLDDASGKPRLVLGS